MLGSAALTWSNAEEDSIDVDNVFKVALYTIRHDGNCPY